MAGTRSIMTKNVVAVIILHCIAAIASTVLRGPAAQDLDEAVRIQEDDVFSDKSAGTQTQDSLFIEVLSRPRSCSIKVNGKTVLYRDKLDAAPPSTYFHSNMRMDGMYVVSVNPWSGERTGEARASGHGPNGAFFGMEEFINNVQKGRILIFCTVSESALSMDRHGEALFTALNFSYTPDIQIRSMVAMVAIKGERIVAESYNPNLDSLDPSHPGYAIRLATLVPSKTFNESSCPRLRDLENRDRLAFCQTYDGYRGLCDCDNPTQLKYPPNPFEDGSFFEYPVIILATNRPQYLFRCLTSLLPVRGLNTSRLVVFMDGDFPEVRRLLALLGVRLHRHVVEMVGLASRAVSTRIGFNYRYTLETAFNMFPNAEKLVILEEDLEVSPDFLSYFQQTHHLLDEDVSLYCISAWNDHGYNHTVGDPAMLYRVGFLPGLGWMMKRSLFFEEVVPLWPEDWKTFDWDVLLRTNSFRRDRDCVIPDVPRTYHFGFIGNHVEAGMQLAYFYDHALNTIPDVRLKDVDNMIYHKYEALLQRLVSDAIKVDGSESNSTSCKMLIPSNTKNQTYVVFVRMLHADDTEPWAKIATCLNLWDLDTRGDHHGIWRFWYNGNHVIVMGIPFSNLAAFAVHKKDDLTIFSGKRSKEMQDQGRFPPGLHRDTSSDRNKRIRLAAAAVDIDPSSIREVTENSRHQG